MDCSDDNISSSSSELYTQETIDAGFEQQDGNGSVAASTVIDEEQNKVSSNYHGSKHTIISTIRKEETAARVDRDSRNETPFLSEVVIDNKDRVTSEHERVMAESPSSEEVHEASSIAADSENTTTQQNNAANENDALPVAASTKEENDDKTETDAASTSVVVDEDPDTERTCWVCIETESNDPAAEWVKPCRCKGTTKWVHHACLMRWIDEQQNGQTGTKVSCPQCNTEYHIILPELGRFCILLQGLDNIIQKVSPMVASGLLLGSVYWTAVTYGASTIMQILGHTEGLDLMECTDPFFLLLGLPIIPVGLILGKLVPWDDFLLRGWRRHSHIVIPILNYSFSTGENAETNQSIYQPPPPYEEPMREIKLSRVFCGAMLFPTAANVVGNWLFPKVHGNLQRTILGGVIFVTVKGVMNIYKKHQLYNQSVSRKIVDFDENVHHMDEGSPTDVISLAS